MGLLDSLAEKVARAVVGRMPRPDLRSFDDPLALEIPWTKLDGSSSNFQSLALKDDGQGTLRYGPSASLYAIAVVLIAGGLAWLGYQAIQGNPPAALLGLVPIAIGGYTARPRSTRFDRNLKQCTLGDDQLPFERVYALQLLQHEVSSGEDSAGYTSYQLNLVLDDKTRVHLLSHSALGALRSDAERISQHIGCKLWDAPGAPKLSTDEVIATAKAKWEQEQREKNG
jgi:hypothetical protein